MLPLRLQTGDRLGGGVNSAEGVPQGARRRYHLRRGDTAVEKADIMRSFGLRVAPSATELGSTVAKALETVA